MLRTRIGVALTAVLLVGCGTAATQAPTPAPTPAPTSAPTPAVEASLGDLAITVTSDSSGEPFVLAAGDYSVLWSAEDCDNQSFAAWLVKPSAPTDTLGAPWLASGLGASSMSGDYLTLGVAAGRYLVSASDDCKSWTLTLTPATWIAATPVPTPTPTPRADIAAQVTDRIDALMCAKSSPPGWCEYLQKKDGLYDVALADGVLTVTTAIPDTTEAYEIANEMCRFIGGAHYDSEGVDLGYSFVDIKGVEYGLGGCETTDPQ